MSSKGYRRFLKRDLERVGPGVSAGPFQEENFLSLMRITREKLRISIGHASVSPLMHFLYESFERSAAQLSHHDMACRKGCSHCCNIWTDAYAPEVFFVAKTLSRNADSGISSSIEKTGEFSSNISFNQREKLPIPCPLLVNNACSVYDLRPLNCRTAVSLEDEACRKAFIEGLDVEIPVPPGWGNLGQIYSMALKGALYHANLVCEPYEWNSALRQTVEDPDLEKRWLLGEEVLAGTPLASSTEPFTHPFWRNLYNRAFAD